MKMPFFLFVLMEIEWGEVFLIPKKKLLPFGFRELLER